jgi:pimeloyl-ACP methyl ester carboxylesterase
MGPCAGQSRPPIAWLSLDEADGRTGFPLSISRRSMKMGFIRERVLTYLAKGFVTPARPPILKRPSDLGLDYEDVFFPALDGVNLEGWFIPATSNRVAICNHFMGANRQGYPGHLREWRTITIRFEMDFLPRYKALHDAGYNVLAYDLRNHGQSGDSNGGRLSMGILEARDVVGSVRYIRNRDDTANMDIYLMSLCLGCVSTFNAMSMYPEEFEGIKAFIALQPLSADAFITGIGKRYRIKDPVDDFDRIVTRYTGFRVSDAQMPKIAHAVKAPTMLVQVHDDFMTLPSDLEAIYANFGTDDKKLLWIENTNDRFEAYRYFENKPDEMIEWFDSHR